MSSTQSRGSGAVPTVSIITPCFNCERYLDETLRSVLGQTLVEWELIAVDDGSTDRTPQILAAWASRDSRFRVFHQQTNQGAAAARNRAISEAKGRFIAFLDSDDLWVESKLEKQVNFMVAEGVALSYSPYRIVDEDGRLSEKAVIPPLDLGYKDMLYTNHIGCLTAMYDTAVLGKQYMDNLYSKQDYTLWLKILRKGSRAKGLAEPLAIYRRGHKSLSSSKLKVAWYQWTIYRKVLHLAPWWSAWYFLHYALRGFLKARTK